jgi:hypothetical protein
MLIPLDERHGDELLQGVDALTHLLQRLGERCSFLPPARAFGSRTAAARSRIILDWIGEVRFRVFGGPSYVHHLPSSIGLWMVHVASLYRVLPTKGSRIRMCIAESAGYVLA